MQAFYSFQSEWLKRRRSAASWLTLTGGLFIPAVILVARMAQHSKTLLANASQNAWDQVFNQCWQYMSIFLLPMGIALAASLITQIEYRNNGWKQLHATPQTLTCIFAAKLVVVLAMLLQFFVVFNAGVYAAGIIPAVLLSNMPFPQQPFPVSAFLHENAKFFICCLPVLGLQYLLSMHIKNFIIPIGIGFGMLVASLIGVGWEYGYIFPYTYCSLQFLVNDNRIDPDVNIQLWSIGYFVLFTAINYVLYRYRNETLSMRRLAGIVSVIITTITLIYIASNNRGNSGEPISTAAKVSMLEASVGLDRFKATNMDLTSIQARMKYYHINGVSIAVITNYRIDWVKSYGMADVATGKRVNEQTLFEPGSISKSINALGLMKLYEEGKIDLFRDINDYLVTWKFPYDKKYRNKRITLAQLLSHSAGLTVHGFGFSSFAEGDTLPSIYQILDGAPPANTGPVRSMEEPGRKYRYSGGGTMLSQLVAMDITGKPYADYIKQTVLIPLGMTHSFFDQPPPREKKPLLATGYTSINNNAEVRGKYPVQPQQAAAGLWTTSADLATMIIGIQRSLRGDDSTFLGKQTARLMLTPYNDRSAGMGFFIEQRGADLYFHHAAGNPGFSGKYYASMEGGNGVVVLANSDDDPQFLDEVIRATARVYSWKGFKHEHDIVEKQVVGLPPALQNKYKGTYRADNRIIIISKDGEQLMYTTDGTTWPMHFTSDSAFFNIESPASKRLLRNNTGVALEIKDKKTTIVANKIPLKNVSQKILMEYAGTYTEQSTETSTLYVDNNTLWLSSTNATHPQKLVFISDDEFYIDKLGGLFMFIRHAATHKVLGIKSRQNADGDFLLTRDEEID